MKGLVDLDPSFREEDPACILADQGVPEGHAKWLADLMVDPDSEFFWPGQSAAEFDDLLMDRVRQVGAVLGPIFRQHDGDPDTALVHALSVLQGYNGDLRRTVSVVSRPGDPVSTPWERRWHARPINWAKGLVGLACADPSLLHPTFVSNLLLSLDTSATGLCEVVDWVALRALGRDPERPLEPSNPRRLEFWVEHLPLGLQARDGGPGVLALCFQKFDGQSDAQAGDWASGLSRAVEYGLPKYLFNSPERVLDGIAPFLKSVDARLRHRPSDLGLRRAQMRMALLTIRIGQEAGRPAMSDADRQAVAESARDYLGRVRPLLRGEDTATEAAVLAPDLVRACVGILMRLESPWSALKRLLLLLSSLRTAAVARDLRYWDERDAEPPPKPWSVIPEQIAAVLHSLAAQEQRDPTLAEFREQFARFALDRLKTRDGVEADKTSFADTDFVEDRPVWRECYIRAVRELRIDPRGKGHHVLHWVSQHDPQLELREIAKTVKRELRHGVDLAPGVSPRVALFAAFWWLRQAHLLSVGVTDIDPKGAQRTRAKEVRRTSLKDK